MISAKTPTCLHWSRRLFPSPLNLCPHQFHGTLFCRPFLLSNITFLSVYPLAFILLSRLPRYDIASVHPFPLFLDCLYKDSTLLFLQFYFCISTFPPLIIFYFVFILLPTIAPVTILHYFIPSFYRFALFLVHSYSPSLPLHPLLCLHLPTPSTNPFPLYLTLLSYLLLAHFVSLTCNTASFYPSTPSHLT